MKILFVCIGNICRSPIAEGVMKNICNVQKLDWIIDSAGTYNYHIGEAPHPDSQKVCKRNGIDISKQRARQFGKIDFEKFDIIYALATDVKTSLEKIATTLEEKNKIILLLDELYEQKGRSVKDPWYGTYSDYEDVFAEIKNVCNVIAKKYFQK
jgi:protein-tyrosine phosphatase